MLSKNYFNYLKAQEEWNRTYKLKESLFFPLKKKEKKAAFQLESYANHETLKPLLEPV